MTTNPVTRIAGRSPGVWALALALVLWFPSVTTPSPGEEYRSPADGILRMSYDDGRMSLETRNAPLDKVLREFARLADVKVVSDGPLEDRVTVYVSALPPDAAARRLLRGKDLSFIYRASKDTDTPEDYPLREIRIYDDTPGTPGREQAVSYGGRQAPVPQQATRARSETRAETRAVARARALESRTPRDDPASTADSFLTGLLGGNLHALDEVAERLVQEHPEAEAQIQQFLEALEEAKARAMEGGGEMPSMEDLGGMGAIMQRMMLQHRDEGE